mgnify:CR=1 FL=1
MHLYIGMVSSTGLGEEKSLIELKNADIEKIAVDGAGAQDVLKKDLKEYGIKIKIVLPKVKDVIVANNMFEQSITSLKNICHNGQESLRQVVTNCIKRAIGTNGGFGYKAGSHQENRVVADLFTKTA